MKNINKKNILLACSLLVIFIMGMTLAYFTSTDTVTNRFKAGSVKIELVEDDYDDLSSNDKILAAGQKMVKDPAVVNKGKNAAVVFLEVRVPLNADARLVDSNGALVDISTYNQSEFQLFNLLSNSTNGITTETVSNGTGDSTTFQHDKFWTLLSSNKDGDEYVYIFGYTMPLQSKDTSKTEGDTETPELFDHIQLKSIIENKEVLALDGSKTLWQAIDVKAYGINVDGVIDGVTKDTATITTDQLRTFWTAVNGD